MFFQKAVSRLYSEPDYFSWKIKKSIFPRRVGVRNGSWIWAMPLTSYESHYTDSGHIERRRLNPEKNERPFISALWYLGDN